MDRMKRETLVRDEEKKMKEKYLKQIQTKTELDKQKLEELKTEFKEKGLAQKMMLKNSAVDPAKQKIF